MNTIIAIESLSKSYLISHQKQQRHDSLRDVITDNVKSFGRTITGFMGRKDQAENSQTTQEEFWALKDVCLEIKSGERIGIIGRNGAGKTTLLKILGRITEPTQGRITIDGRVASLLEVGTGFHPDLTGRENIFLNGAILGMSRSEIKRKYDEIVAFAEVDKFLDTPVKRYSSGMYVRLAFAVAAHLEPEILLIDEVLAVGDMQFQKKCLGKMEDVSTREGRTIIFVSHNMAMISSLCEKCFLLQGGQIIKEGKTSEVVFHYYSNGESRPTSINLSDEDKPIGDELAILRSAAILDDSDQVVTEIDINRSLKFVMQFKILKDNDIELIPSFHFLLEDGSYAFVLVCSEARIYSEGMHRVECHMPANFLNDRMYSIGVALTSFKPSTINHFSMLNCLILNVRDPICSTPYRYGYGGTILGIIRPQFPWVISKITG